MPNEAPDHADQRVKQRAERVRPGERDEQDGSRRPADEPDQDFDIDETLCHPVLSRILKGASRIPSPHQVGADDGRELKDGVPRADNLPAQR